MRDGKVRVVCLSGFKEAETDDRNALKDVTDALDGLQESTNFDLTPIDGPTKLVDALKDDGLKDVDVLVLAAHGYPGGLLKIGGKGFAKPGEVVDALKQRKLPKDAILFIFACSAATSPELNTLFPAGERGPQMVFASTRACPSHPMRDALRCVLKAVIENKLDVEYAKSITKDIKGCQPGKQQGTWVEPETEFLKVIFG
jgi:hypothetical protein